MLWLFWINSVNIDARSMILPPLDSSHRDESNDINFVEIRSLDAELFRENVSLHENRMAREPARAKARLDQPSQAEL